MVDVITGLYDFTLPEVGGSDDTWGDKLNANWQKMETLLAASFPSGTPSTLGERIALSGGSPRIDFTETDAVSPAGRYRFTGIAAGTFRLEKAGADGTYTAPTIVWNTDGTTFSFTQPIVGTTGKFGNIYVGGTPAGAVAATNISAATSSSLILRGGIDTTAMIQFVNATGAEVARIDPAGTALADPQSIVTQEKGDARYLQLAAGTGSVIIGETIWEKSGIAIRIKSAADATGYGTLLYSDVNTFYIMLTANNAADGTWSALRPFSIAKATGNVSMSENLTVSGFARIADIFVGANPAGVISPPTISAATGEQLRLRGGLATGSIVTIRDSADAVLGTFVPAGSAIVDINTVVNVQKGDFRYATLTATTNTFSVINAFNGASKFNANTEMDYVYTTSTTASAANMHISATGPGRLYRSTSSGKFKTSRTAIPNPGAIIDALDPLSFQSTHAEDEGRRFTGFVAEDVAAAFPEAAADNGENYDVRALVAALWAEVKQHRARITTLEATP